jgi:hypothetical protein
MLWPLFKRRRKGGLWAVQALVPGDSLGDLSLAACLFEYRIKGSLGDWRPKIERLRVSPVKMAPSQGLHRRRISVFRSK